MIDDLVEFPTMIDALQWAVEIMAIVLLIAGVAGSLLSGAAAAMSPMRFLRSHVYMVVASVVIPLGSLIVVVLLESSCYDPRAQSSKIVQEVESEGSGNLSTFTQQGLVAWFSLRPQLARQIVLECLPLKTRADAHWAETAEGTVCRSAEIAQRPVPVIADQRAW